MKKTTKNLINATIFTVGGSMWAWNYTELQSIRRDALDEIDALEKSATKKDKAKEGSSEPKERGLFGVLFFYPFL